MTATSAGQLTRPIADAAGPSARRLLTVLLRRYGIPVAESVTADSADCAVEAAWWLGFPVTLVAEGARLAGRPEITRCGLATPAQVRVAYRRLAASIGSAMTGVRIRRQPQQGAEVIVRLAREAGGEAHVSLVLGGPAGALVGASVSRLAPLTARDASDMLDELHGRPTAPRPDAVLAAGGRDRQRAVQSEGTGTPATKPGRTAEPGHGAEHAHAAEPGRTAEPGHGAEHGHGAEPGRTAEPGGAAEAGHGAAPRVAAEPAPVSARSADEPAALDVAALAGLLERVSRLAMRVPQVTELELNPVIVTRCGAAVAGVRGRFQQSGDTHRSQVKLRRVS
ncbi:MAG TPA: acetate--CoA ligase family protein [Streptosporangiaceae bacterium]|nr:acetate--CoA ligase family protein [Streptosporangiaceae bacterium]